MRGAHFLGWLAMVLAVMQGRELATEIVLDELDAQIVPSKMLVGWHSLSPEWPVGDRVEGAITAEDMAWQIYDLGLTPQVIALKDICHKDMTRAAGESLTKICGRKTNDTKRAGRGPPEVPGILLRSKTNPCRLPFTMLDGAHRICKLKTSGTRSSSYFVLDEPTATRLVSTNLKQTASRGHRRPRSKHALTPGEAMDVAWYLARQYYALE